MKGKVRNYIKYSKAELEEYAKYSDTCVKKINKSFHINFPPYGLSSIKETLPRIMSENKIGRYDHELKGIILDLKNIKILDSKAAIRFNDPTLHINVQANVYVFIPQIGANVRGIIKYISSQQIGVIIYRVFNVAVRLSENSLDYSSMQINSEIEIKIKNFDLDNRLPYIEGTLICKEMSFRQIVINKPNSLSDSEDNIDNFNEMMNLEDPTEISHNKNKYKKKSKTIKSGEKIEIDGEYKEKKTKKSNKTIQFSEDSCISINGIDTTNNKASSKSKKSDKKLQTENKEEDEIEIPSSSQEHDVICNNVKLEMNHGSQDIFDGISEDSTLEPFQNIKTDPDERLPKSAKKKSKKSHSKHNENESQQIKKNSGSSENDYYTSVKVKKEKHSPIRETSTEISNSLSSKKRKYKNTNDEIPNKKIKVEKEDDNKNKKEVISNDFEYSFNVDSFVEPQLSSTLIKSEKKKKNKLKN